MSYVDIFWDRNKNKIHVVERNNGIREFKVYKPIYSFYYEDETGTYKSLYGTNIRKVTAKTYEEYENLLLKAKSEKKITYEADVKPEFRVLAKHYPDSPAPTLNIALLDIETMFYPQKSYAPPTDPFAEITGITVHLSWTGDLISLILYPPKHLKCKYTWEEAQEIASKFDNTIIFRSELELLETLFDLLEDADVISGYNSTGFDLPYIVNRAERLKKGLSNRLCLWGQKPREKKYRDKYGGDKITYTLIGRVHLDYIDLYQKHNPQQLHSYRLDAVAEHEKLGNKVPNPYTFDVLYLEYLELFIEYNRQDVHLLHLIDKNKKFIQLANQVAHANSVPLPTTMGTVQLVEQAIMNEAHNRDMILPNRAIDVDEEEIQEIDTNIFNFDNENEDDEEYSYNNHIVIKEKLPVVGAYVADPVKGRHDNVGAIDIKSMYPNTIMSLNMSPETLFGQIRPIETDALIHERLKKLKKNNRPQAWNGLFAILEYTYVMEKRTDKILTIDFIGNETIQMTASELYEFIFASNLTISANGTIFSNDSIGIIPSILMKWFSERKAMQAIEKKYTDMIKGVKISKELLSALT